MVLVRFPFTNLQTAKEAAGRDHHQQQLSA